MSGHLDPALLSPEAAPSADERERLLAHVVACADCRGAWIDAEPSRLFRLLALEPVPEAALDRLTAKLDLELRRDAGSRRRRGRSAGWLSLAASLALAALLGSGLIGVDDRGPDRRAGTGRALDPSAELPVAEIHLLSSPGEAQVLDLSVGGTSVMMIFDRDLDI